MDKETDTVKANELTKKGKRDSSVAIVIGLLSSVASAASIRTLISISSEALGSWLGIISIITEITAITGIILGITSVNKSQRRNSFIMAKVGRWLSIVSIIVFVIAWAVFFVALFTWNP